LRGLIAFLEGGQGRLDSMEEEPRNQQPEPNNKTKKAHNVDGR
jgi:hypothetical protein